MTTNANGAAAVNDYPVKKTLNHATDFSTVSTGATSFAAYLGHHTYPTGQFEPETTRVMQQTDEEWLAEYDAADPLVKPPVSGIVGAKPKGPVIRTTLSTAVYFPTAKGILLCPEFKTTGISRSSGCGLGASVRKADDVTVLTVRTPSPPDAIRTVSSGCLFRTGMKTMATSQITHAPSKGNTTPDHTSLSFVKVEHKGPRKQRLTTWFNVPDQDYGTGNVTGYRAAAELLAWVQTNPADYGTGLVVREVMSEAFAVLAQPHTPYGTPDRRGAAVGFLDAMAQCIQLVAHNSNHQAYFAGKAQQSEEWAKQAAQIEEERNRATGQRLAAARRAKREARQQAETGVASE